MQNSAPTIDSLMKVHLTIKRDGMDDVPFAFIYGVGSDGLTPFEKALFGKCVGDSLRMEIPARDHCAILGHLESPLGEQAGIRKPGTLQITVTDVSRAADREVVQAMASGGGCSDCGCGCGAH